jgi:membrane-associated phospholipid phosphatase
MQIAPTSFDIWLTTLIVRHASRYPHFDQAVQSAIRHNVLGGLAYASSLFVFWVKGPTSESARRRILTTLVASAVATGAAIIAGYLLSWPPPARNSKLEAFFAGYFDFNPNTNCFPSESTALYSAVAAGIYSLCRRLGLLLWAGIIMAVALPRIYVGGHYPTDVLAGLLLGLGGYTFARYLLEAPLVAPIERLFRRGEQLRVLGELVVFFWILQVAVEFRDMVWLKNCLLYVIG